MGIVFALFLLILLNIYPQYAGIVYFDGDEVTVIVNLSENFYANLLPWINLILVISVIFDAFKLYTGRKTRLVVGLNLVMALLTAVVVYMLMTRGPIFGLNEPLMAAYGDVPRIFSDGAAALTDLFNTLAGIGLPIVFALEIISAGKAAYDLWRMDDRKLVYEVSTKKGN